MKKFLAVILAVITVLTAFASCGGDKGITVVVPNDTTNEARALLLLESLGYIKLKDGAGITATVRDIAENPHNITFKEIEAAQIPNVKNDFDYAIINSNYAIPRASIPPKILSPSKARPRRTATFWL